jgi:hypothetical protein
MCACIPSFDVCLSSYLIHCRFCAKSYSFSLIRRPRLWPSIAVFIELLSSPDIIHRALILVFFICYALAQYEVAAAAKVESSSVQHATTLISLASSADTWSAALVFGVWMYGIHWVASAVWGVKTVVVLRRSFIDTFRVFVSALPLLLGIVHSALAQDASCFASAAVSSLSYMLYDFSVVSTSLIDKGSIEPAPPASDAHCPEFQVLWIISALVFRLFLLPCVFAAIVLQMRCPPKDAFSPITGLADPEVRWRRMSEFTGVHGLYYFAPWFRWPLTLFRRALRKWAATPEATSLHARRAVALAAQRRRPPSPFVEEEQDQHVLASEVLAGMGSTIRALARTEAHFMHRVDSMEQTIQAACEKLLQSAESFCAHSQRLGKGSSEAGPMYPSAVLTDADIIRGELALEYKQNKAKFTTQLAIPPRRFRDISKAVYELGRATERFGNATDALKVSRGIGGTDTRFRRKREVVTLPGSLY